VQKVPGRARSDERRRQVKNQRPAVLLAIPVLCCLSLAACNKRTAGADDQIAPAAANEQKAAPDTDQASQSGTYTGGLGRTRSGAAPVSSSISPTGKEFLTAAAENGTLEIQAGKLAAEKSASLQVKRFADMMVQAHSRVNDSLLQLARANGIEVPVAPGSDGQQLLEKLRGLSGAEFDETYSEEMLKAHKKAVQRFETAAQTASDPQIQAFAEAQLPAMRDQLRVAQTLPGANQG
jgi:putative membrane protein